MFKDMFNIFQNGIIQENGVFALALGLCPALAVTTNVANGIGMGAALIFVLTFSVVVCSLVRSIISPRVRIPVFLAIIAGFVTITDLSLQAYFPALSESLGLFVALIVVNCIVLGRIEVFASKNPPQKALADGLGIGLGFTVALILIGGIREVLGSWSFFGYQLPVPFEPVGIMLLSPGAFITIGILMGFYEWYRKRQTISQYVESKGRDPEEIFKDQAPDEITHADLTERPDASKVAEK
jgi:Na+-translocating ferredoxin:NAD+ oxidoreductase subunit E